MFKVQNWSDGKYSALSFDEHEVLHHLVIAQGQTVNHFHTEWPWEVTWQKQPKKWYPEDWFPHHSTAPAHPSLKVQVFLTSSGMTVVPHALYPADPAHWLLSFPITQDSRCQWRGGNVMTWAEFKNSYRLHLHSSEQMVPSVMPPLNSLYQVASRLIWWEQWGLIERNKIMSYQISYIQKQ